MSAFSSTAFNADSYQSSRPTTPKELLEVIFQYHAENGGKWERCVDLGCGTGQTTRLLRGHFTEVIGADVSSTMITTAQQVEATENKVHGIRFVVTKAEELSFLEDGSVDMVTSSQAAHWFNYEKLWPELGRIMKPNGTIAFWIYAHIRFPKYPLMPRHVIDLTDGPEGFQGFYEEPGYSISESLLEAAPSPGEPFSDVRRIRFSSGYKPLKRIPEYLPEDKKPEIREALLHRRWTWDQLAGYFRSWSGYHHYQDVHKEDKEAAGGDVVSRFIKRMKDDMKAAGGDDEELDVIWSIGLLLAKKSG